jgi:hypothetical protein
MMIYFLMVDKTKRGSFPHHETRPAECQPRSILILRPASFSWRNAWDIWIGDQPFNFFSEASCRKLNKWQGCVYNNPLRTSMQNYRRWLNADLFQIK